MRCIFWTGLIEPGAVAVDAGAHLATHSLRFARAAGPGGRVYAIEAQHDVTLLLAANVVANGLGSSDAYAHSSPTSVAVLRSRSVCATGERISAPCRSGKRRRRSAIPARRHAAPAFNENNFDGSTVDIFGDASERPDIVLTQTSERFLNLRFEPTGQRVFPNDFTDEPFEATCGATVDEVRRATLASSC